MAQATQARLKVRYEQEIRPMLIQRFGYSTPMQAPRIKKITLNMGVGDAKQDSKALEAATEQLATIAGQKPNIRRARKSVAAFKLREGMPVGISVTLRGERSYEFLDRLMSIAIPRIRDFRGMNPRSFDGRGNYSMGVREQIIFPEIDYDAIDQTRGLDITITTSARTDLEAFALLDSFGFPFAAEGRPQVPPLPGEQAAAAAAEPQQQAAESHGANGAGPAHAGEPETPDAVAEAEADAETASARAGDEPGEDEPQPPAAGEPQPGDAAGEVELELAQTGDAQDEPEPQASAGGDELETESPSTIEVGSIEELPEQGEAEVPDEEDYTGVEEASREPDEEPFESDPEDRVEVAGAQAALHSVPQEEAGDRGPASAEPVADAQRHAADASGEDVPASQNDQEE